MIVVRVAGKPEVMFPGSFMIGRGELADLSLDDDEFVSNQHAVVILENGTWYIRDQGSTNGTWYFGSKIWSRWPLIRGARIRVGHTEITLVPVSMQEVPGS